MTIVGLWKIEFSEWTDSTDNLRKTICVRSVSMGKELLGAILIAFLPAVEMARSHASESEPTVVASGVQASAIAIDAAGNVYAADADIIRITPGRVVQPENPSNTKRIRRFSQNGVVFPFASGFPNIGGMAVDGAGN